MVYFSGITEKFTCSARLLISIETDHTNPLLKRGTEYFANSGGITHSAGWNRQH